MYRCADQQVSFGEVLSVNKQQVDSKLFHLVLDYSWRKQFDAVILYDCAAAASTQGHLAIYQTDSEYLRKLCASNLRVSTSVNPLHNTFYTFSCFFPCQVLGSANQTANCQLSALLT